MILKTKGKSYIFIVAGMLFFLLALYFHSNSQKPQINITKQDSALNFNTNLLKIFLIGNKRLLSDIFWIQTMLESDMEKYKNRDLGNWLYLRFLTISILDENFYENYQYGGMYLSIIKDDLEGAADIYDRGLLIFPNDFKLNYQAGFNSYIEMGNYEKGLNYLKKIENHPDTPEIVKFIIKKLEFETNHDFDTILIFLKTSLASTKSPHLINKLQGDIFSLTTERDLECLNQKQANCSLQNIDNQPYLFKNGTWYSPIDYIPYRIHRRKFHRQK
jgi:hypothetical protein